MQVLVRKLTSVDCPRHFLWGPGTPWLDHSRPITGANHLIDSLSTVANFIMPSNLNLFNKMIYAGRRSHKFKAPTFNWALNLLYIPDWCRKLNCIIFMCFRPLCSHSEETGPLLYKKTWFKLNISMDQTGWNITQKFWPCSLFSGSTLQLSMCHVRKSCFLFLTQFWEKKRVDREKAEKKKR